MWYLYVVLPDPLALELGQHRLLVVPPLLLRRVAPAALPLRGNDEEVSRGGEPAQPSQRPSGERTVHICPYLSIFVHI